MVVNLYSFWLQSHRVGFVGASNQVCEVVYSKKCKSLGIGGYYNVTTPPPRKGSHVEVLVGCNWCILNL